MARKFPQELNESFDGLRIVSIGQTRNGVDEWITPITMWELDTSGLYMPPGEAQNPKMPRVEAIVAGGGNVPVVLQGSAGRIRSSPVTGTKTVTSTPAEVFAGSARRPGRSLLMVRNMDPSVRIRIGPSSVTDETGFGVEPGAALVLAIDPLSNVPIYAVSEAGAVEVEVLEA